MRAETDEAFYRRLAAEAAARARYDRWEWLWWNPLVKYGHRLRGTRGRHLLPHLNGALPRDVDAFAFLSVLGWGVVWGWATEAAPGGQRVLALGRDRRPVLARRWGRVEPNDGRGKQ